MVIEFICVALFLLDVVLTILKVSGVIDWDWWIVMIPILYQIALLTVSVLFDLFSSRKDR